jgi:hypothetical protein
MRTAVLALTSTKPWMEIVPFVSLRVALTVWSWAIAFALSRRILFGSPAGWLPEQAKIAVIATASPTAKFRLIRVPER